MSIPKLIVMLTYQDQTVLNAAEIFEQCKNTKAEYFGFKEKPLPLEEMKELFSYMKACGKKTVLEVVGYSEEAGLEGAKIAAECGCDYLMGTCFHDSIREYCQEQGIRYLPFIGQVEDRPSVLRGTWEEMAQEAGDLMEKGVYGVDLLGYRYVGDAADLNCRVVKGTLGPVCIAGSVNSYERLDEICEAGAWAFTIGGAFFEQRFGDHFAEQIDRVCDYISRKETEK